MTQFLSGKLGLIVSLAFLCLVGAGLYSLSRLAPAGAATPPTPSPRPTIFFPPYVNHPQFYPASPTPGGPPTPTLYVPAVTPTPLSSTEPSLLPPYEAVKLITPGPDDPLRITYIEEGGSNISAVVDRFPVIAIGNVVEVPPARWATADGRRPDFRKVPRPGGGIDSDSVIVTLVSFQVEEYLKGPQPSQTLVLRVIGGRVGDDIYDAYGPVQALKQKGGRFVVYLLPSEGRPGDWWFPARVASASADGTLKDGVRTWRLEDLRAAIKGQATPIPKP